VKHFYGQIISPELIFYRSILLQQDIICAKADPSSEENATVTFPAGYNRLGKIRLSNTPVRKNVWRKISGNNISQ
jgi:hypothetical protein